MLAFIDGELTLAAASEPEHRSIDPRAREEANALFRVETLRLDAPGYR